MSNDNGMIFFLSNYIFDLEFFFSKGGVDYK